VEAFHVHVRGDTKAGHGMTEKRLLYGLIPGFGNASFRLVLTAKASHEYHCLGEPLQIRGQMKITLNNEIYN
jgi:hypothetical protein